VGEAYVGKVEHSAGVETFSGSSFAGMMLLVSHILWQEPGAGLLIQRTDREGMLPVQLEPALLQMLRNDPEGYIKANTIAPRTIDLRKERTSALAAKHETPRYGGLRSGLNTLADAFGEVIYAKAKKWAGGVWRYEHPATGRWSDLPTIEYWLQSHDTEVQPLDDKTGWLLLSVEQLLKVAAERYYFPREWNEFGSWITKEQLRQKLEQFRKEKANVR
jgi:hypothetical protein